MNERKTCIVEDGKHVRPCLWLEKATDGRGNYGRERGLRYFDYTNMETGKPTRSFYAIKSAEFPKALAISYCPFCGTDISAPWAVETEEARTEPQP